MPQNRTPVLASADGTVTFAGPEGDWGLTVVVKHTGGFSTRYAHLVAIAVNKNDPVSQGQVLGYIGSSGESFVSHVHFLVL